jgi:phage terminase Nu1 subunit (DNA packaging protein)
MSHDHSQPGDTGANPLAEYLTETQLAEQLGVTRRTLRTWKTMGDAPVVTKVGVKVLYHVDDVRTWLRAQRREVA